MISTKGKTLGAVLHEIADATIKQGVKCIRDGVCHYNIQGKHCSIGFLLSDSFGDQGGVLDIIQNEEIEEEENFDFICEHKRILDHVQILHDNNQNQNSTELRDEMKNINSELLQYPEQLEKFLSFADSQLN